MEISARQLENRPKRVPPGDNLRINVSLLKLYPPHPKIVRAHTPFNPLPREIFSSCPVSTLQSFRLLVNGETPLGLEFKLEIARAMLLCPMYPVNRLIPPLEIQKFQILTGKRVTVIVTEEIHGVTVGLSLFRFSIQSI